MGKAVRSRGTAPLLLMMLALGLVCLGNRAEARRPRDMAAADWRRVATDGDRERIRNWRGAWLAALAKARAGGHDPEIAAAGATLQPDAALANPVPPEGSYRCRTVKLGARGAGGQDYVAYPAFTCRVRMEAGVLSFAKLDGSQRPVGLLFPGSPERMIFLGTMMLSDETAAQQYGRDPERDMAGAFERVGRDRWRLVLPFPRWESTLDVIELVPAKG